MSAGRDQYVFQDVHVSAANGQTLSLTIRVHNPATYARENVLGVAKLPSRPFSHPLTTIFNAEDQVRFQNTTSLDSSTAFKSSEKKNR
jgi:hypothetical protein